MFFQELFSSSSFLLSLQAISVLPEWQKIFIKDQVEEEGRGEKKKKT